MSEKAIKRLQRKFIFSAMMALIATMFFIAGCLYIGSSILNIGVIHRTLDYIVENEGNLVEYEEDANNTSTSLADQYTDFIDNIFSINYRSSEFRYATRYFTLNVADDESVSILSTKHISSIDEEKALEYGRKAIENGREYGRIDEFYYKVGELNDGSHIAVFLLSDNILSANSRLLYLSLTLIGVGMVVAFFLVKAFSKKVIAGELENAELQKRFITDVSHELKTPLAVIRANTEMSEMLNGSDEWSQSTMRQIDRMDGLIKNLVTISRADEAASCNLTDEIDISAAIKDTVENFKGLARSYELELEYNIEEGVMMLADDAKCRQLCSLIVDNAIKYCDQGGKVSVDMAKKGKGIVLTVSNSYKDGENVDYTRFFERFYREDESHNVDKGGYGIGLSVAESIVKQYHGSIDVSYKDGVISFTCNLKRP